MMLRLATRDARALLLVEAVEETDPEGVLLSLPAREAASRRAFDQTPGAADDGARLKARAEILRDDLLHGAPAMGRLLEPAPAPKLLVGCVLAAAAASGALSNLFGPDRHVSVLAFPLAGVLGWNLAVYAVIAVGRARQLARVFRRADLAPRRLGSLGRWLARAYMAGRTRNLGASLQSAVAADSARRFQELWLRAAAPLGAARARVVLHLAAAAVALGAIVGMYASGIAFEYRATWESTWLEATAVQGYLDTVLGPAASLLGAPVPPVAPIRGPAGEGSARPWIHLWGLTLGLFVLIPRTVLASLEWIAAARLSRRLPVVIDDGYARRVLASGRGAATEVRIVHYSCRPDEDAHGQIQAAIREQAGARAVIRAAARLEYGDGAESVDLPARTPEVGLVAVVFSLAQTPEREVHGEFLGRLRERLEAAGWQLMVVLGSAAYRRNVGSDDRVRERQATWHRLLEEWHVTAIDVG
jgi:hypothetical protein